MILATIKKEILLMLRDIHALAVLFLMPLAFIIIMSIAMQNTYSKQAAKINGALITETESEFAQHLELYLKKNPQIHWATKRKLNREQAIQAIRNNELDFALHIDQPENSTEKPANIKLYLKPDISAHALAVIHASLRESLGKNRLHNFLQQMNNASDEQVMSNIDTISSKDTYEETYVFQDGSHTTPPSSVQQSVPAWLVFAMFFVLIPMSSTIITERQTGTLRRLRTMHITSNTYLTGKIIPFFIINQLQLMIMLAAGRWIIPLLGGESLVINGGTKGIMVMSISTSLAATCFALLISVIARSQEQATALGGTFNILLAAIGGIMVPKFIMPPVMQVIANLSPMSWALDGFLQVILYGGNSVQTFQYATCLIIFAMISFSLASYIFQRRTHYND